jgi:hypothetical protein
MDMSTSSDPQIIDQAVGKVADLTDSGPTDATTPGTTEECNAVSDFSLHVACPMCQRQVIAIVPRPKPTAPDDEHLRFGFGCPICTAYLQLDFHPGQWRKAEEMGEWPAQAYPPPSPYPPVPYLHPSSMFYGMPAAPGLGQALPYYGGQYMMWPYGVPPGLMPWFSPPPMLQLPRTSEVGSSTEARLGAEVEDRSPLGSKRAGVTRPTGRPSLSYLSDVEIVPSLALGEWVDTLATKTAKSSRALLVGGIALALLLCGGVIGYSNRGDTAVKGDVPKFPPSPTFSIIPEQRATEAARECMLAFQSATTDEERLRFVIDADRVAPRLRDYYRNGAHLEIGRRLEPSELLPVKINRSDLDKGIVALTLGANQKRQLLLFKAADTGGTSDRWSNVKLDWESWIQERDETLQRFLSEPQAEPAVFRVTMRRRHHFGPVQSNLPAPLAMGLGTLGGVRLDRPALVAYDHELYERFDEQMSWSSEPIATVRLRWEPKSRITGLPEVHIDQLVCWEAVNVGGQAEDPVLVSQFGGRLIRPNHLSANLSDSDLR